MPNSTRMTFPYPSENQDPWFQKFEDFVGALDASAYAAREDRSLIIGGGGNFNFVAGTDSFGFDATLEIFSPIKGFKFSIAPTTIALTEGECVYVDLVRGPTGNTALSILTSAQVPSSDTAYIIAIRSGSSVFFRHGFELASGSTTTIFTGGGGSGSTVLWAGGRESHNSETPLVVGAFAFTPVTHDPVTTMVFRAVAANSDIGLTNKVRLINVTDGEIVAELSFTSTSIAKDEATLTRGAAIGEIDDPEHIYEVQILLGAAPVATETIELYSAELRVF